MARTIDIPQEALEMAYTVQDQFPGMAVEDIALELIIQGVESQKRKQEAREQAIETLPKLSPGALEYVVKPIEWAYNWTDGNNPDSMSKEDIMRFLLICHALNGTGEHVKRLYEWDLALSHTEMGTKEAKR